MKKYSVTKMSIDGAEINYGGGYSEEDVKSITRGYKFNGVFYDRKGSRWFYVVSE